MNRVTLLSIVYACFLSSLVKCHASSANETAPAVVPNATHCLECLKKSSDNYWCPADQKCYYYNSTFDNISGRDCTRVADYKKHYMWTVPAINQF